MKSKKNGLDTIVEIETNQENLKELELQLVEFNNKINNIKEMTNSVHLLKKEIKKLEQHLPIYAYRSKILDYVQKNQIILIVAETGSGKSTQCVQYLSESGYADKKKIICTQPRSFAARTLAKRVSEEQLSIVGNEVGFQVSSEKKFNNDSKIVFMTGRTFLKNLIRDISIPDVSCVIIDEAHERSVDTDLILGYIQKAMDKRPDLKVIVTSATLDQELFSKYFNNCPVITIPGRVFPVETIYHSKPENEKDLIEDCVQLTLEIHKNRQGNSGDILVFLTCQEEIENAIQKITSYSYSLKNEIIVLPLHGKLPPDEQSLVLEPTPKGKRKIVFSTNVAESSVTIPGISYVIDSGMVKENFYDLQKNMSILEKQFISQCSAKQRKGRAGRTGPGIVHRMYSVDDYELMEEFKIPEMFRIHLDEVVLKLIQMGIKNFLDFNFIEAPPEGSLEKALETVVNLGAVDKKTMKITPFGKLVFEMSLKTEITKFLFEGMKNDAFNEALIIVSMLTVSNMIFWRGNSLKEQQESEQKKISFSHEKGDLFTYLNVFNKFSQCAKDKDQSKWCVQNYINKKAMLMAKNKMKEIRKMWELNQFVKKTPKRIFETEEKVETKLIRAATSAFYSNLCISNGNMLNGYNILSLDLNAIIHPSSSLYAVPQNPKFVIYHQFLKTSQLFVKDLLETEKSIILQEVPKEFLESTKLEEKEIKELIISDLETLVTTKLKSQKDLKTLGDENQCMFTVSTGSISTWIPKYNYNNVETKLKEIISSTKESLKLQNFPHFIEEFGIKVIVSHGGIVSDIHFEDDFDTILISKLPNTTTKKDLLDLLSRFGQLNQIELLHSKNKNSWAYITFDKKESAKLALTELNGFEQPFSIQIKIDPLQHASPKSIQIRWYVGEPISPAFIEFKSEVDAYKAVGLGAKLSTKGDKRNTIYIPKPSQDEIEYKKYYSGFGSVNYVSIKRKPVDESELDVDFYKQLYSMFEKFGTITQFINIPVGNLRIVRIGYTNLESVKKSTQNSFLNIKGLKLHVDVDSSYDFKLETAMYNFMKKTIESCISEIEKQYGNYIKIKIQPKGKYTSVVIRSNFNSKLTWMLQMKNFPKFSLLFWFHFHKNLFFQNPEKRKFQKFNRSTKFTFQ
jgi:HrpA-like RNA helicase